MPELPEVETVRSGLETQHSDQPIIKSVILMRSDIRFEIPPELPARLKNQKILGVRRRAKYLLIDTPKVILLSHLGMTGSWRFTDATAVDADKHDHCYIELSDGRKLACRYPRRFGLLVLIEPGHEDEHPRLKSLGPEPLDETLFTGDYLFKKSRKRHVAVKSFIMDQKIVVGVGNIYASEALFRARVRPQRLAGRLSQIDSERLVEAIRSVLSEAIVAGGSSIRDYRNASGEAGEFQASHQVYERGGQPCRVCGAQIRSKVIGGRSTYWCPSCQK
jgi:formamidopyrimidine-DNA glycosylase